MKQLKKWNVNKQLLCTAFLCIAALACTGCSAGRQKTILIWTNSAEFASYVELFNSTHDSEKALLVYKDNPAKALSSIKDETPPDIVVGPWLRTDKTSRFFRPIDTIFDKEDISSSAFYSQLLAAGRIKSTQYLLPVSFNLPAVIFSADNQDFVEDSYMLSLSQIRKAGASFNKQKEGGIYTQIGFAPQSNSEFLYFIAKTKNARFRESKKTFTWSQDGLSDTISYIRTWTKDANTSSKAEQDFIYKYLSMPQYKQVTSGRTLFAYVTSDRLFRLSTDQTSRIDYRWICEDNKIPIEDSMIMLGISRKARHTGAAASFIAWFLNADTQHKILENKAKIKLDTDQFGIANGFSSIKEVNEHILPLYDTRLLTNTPPAELLSVPEKLPADWVDMKKEIVLPYLKEEAENASDKQAVSLSSRLSEWTKQNYN